MYPSFMQPSVLGFVNEGVSKYKGVNLPVVVWMLAQRRPLIILAFREYCVRFHLGLQKPDLQKVTFKPQSGWHTLLCIIFEEKQE